MNTLGDFFRKQVSAQDQRAIVKNEIQILFPEFFAQHQEILSQDIHDIDSLHRIKAQIGSSLGNEAQHLWRYLEDIRQHGYQSANYRHFFELARSLVDQLEEISYAKEDIFALLDWHKKSLEISATEQVMHNGSRLKVSLNNSPQRHHSAKHKDKKSGVEQQPINIMDIVDLIQQAGFSISPTRQSTIIQQLQSLPDISQRRLLAHLTLLNKCSSILDKYKYMTKLRNGRISIKFDYENFYRLGIEKDGTCAGILAKGHEYDNFTKT